MKGVEGVEGAEGAEGLGDGEMVRKVQKTLEGVAGCKGAVGLWWGVLACAGASFLLLIVWFASALKVDRTAAPGG